MTTELAAPRAPAMDMGTLSDPRELGTVLAASGYFSDARDAAQAVVKVLAGAELGIPPVASMTGVFIVKGRVTLSANLMAACIRRHPKYDYRIREISNDRAEVQFFMRKPDGEWSDEGTSEFSMADAQKAGLANGENWKKYPRNMLLWRAMSNGAKFFAPDAFSGAPVYMADELGLEIDGATGEIIEVENVSTVPAHPSVSPAPEPAAPPDRKSAVEPAPTTEPAGEVETPAAPVAKAEDPPVFGHGDDASRQVSLAEADRLKELLDQLGAPEPFRRMALMTYRVDDFDALNVGQAAEIMAKANDRFAVKS